MDTSIISSPNKKQNRTPNTECIICGKPLYRRPFELKKIRYAACLEHREIAKSQIGATEAQKKSLALGREKGINHLEGIPKSEESKRKRSIAMRQWVKENPNAVRARGKKTRGENHCNWKGGGRPLNHLIRDIGHKSWAEAVKERDKACVVCGSTRKLQSHHIIPISTLIEQLDITSVEEARRHIDILWDIDNGETLCKKCHFKRHGKEYHK